MSVNIGTSTSQYATANSFQRKLLKSTNGTLLLFAYLGDGVGVRIQYKTSSDDGVTWSSWNDCGFVDDSDFGNFDVYIDTTDDIYIAHSRNNVNGIFKKLTYSAGTWSNGSPIGLGVMRDNISITKRSNGDIYVIGGNSTNTDLACQYSSDGGSSWNDVGTTYSPGNSLKSIPIGSNIYVFHTYSTSLYYKFYNGSSWDTAWGTSFQSGIINGAIDVLKVSDTEIYLVARTTSGLKLFTYNGSTWDSGLLLSDNTNDDSPSLSLVNSKLTLIWKDYNGSQYDIVYRTYNGASWEAQVNITTDATVDDYPSALEADVDINVIWTSGSGSPYTIYFNKTAITTEEIYDLNNDFRTLKLWSLDNINNDIRTVSNIVWSHINNDFRLTGISFADILNDFRLLASNVLKYDINNHFQSRLEALYEFNNKINIVKLELYNIVNKFNLVEEIKSNINNIVSFFNETKSNVNNDIRTQKLSKNNISNDFRLIVDWMIPGDHGFQSLGWQYLKVYINSVEQTDANLNSIAIEEVLNGSANLSFQLARPYDDTKPELEVEVEVKYNDLRIYKGYLVGIDPTDNPDTMTIRCKNKYWKQNRNNKYFYVGHKPQENDDLYYLTPKEALLAEASLDIGFGDFIPQTIDEFGVKESDMITDLITQSGNYNWYYNKDEEKKVWTAGKGNIINLEPQSIGTNMGLHQIIRHQFQESAENVVNKFRVQMGIKEARTYNDEGGVQIYLSYYKFQQIFYPEPDWDSSLEVLAKDSSTQYGWDYHPDEEDYKYKDVFTKYNIAHLGYEDAFHDEDHLPEVQIVEGPFAGLWSSVDDSLTEGFTIDYENETIILSKPAFSYQYCSDGVTIHRVKRNNILLKSWTKNYYTMPTFSDDPETDVTNPLMFFTDKLGDYPETIMDELDLSGLAIQEGYSQEDVDGEITVVPSYDDTEFAEDLANWELTKNANKKITGSIDITLDSFKFHNIDLSKRIMINGVIENPLNITSISIRGFIVTLNLESFLPYQRAVSIQSRGE